MTASHNSECVYFQISYKKRTMAACSVMVLFSQSPGTVFEHFALGAIPSKFLNVFSRQEISSNINGFLLTMCDQHSLQKLAFSKWDYISCQLTQYIKRKVKCFCSVRISRKSDVFLSVSCMRPRSAESLSEHFCYYNNKNVSLRQALPIKGRMRYTLENHRFLCLRTEQIIITFLLYNEV